MLNQINGSTNAEILDLEVLSDAMVPRGWEQSPALLETISEIWKRSLL
jgi:hypothetical protein